MSTLTKVLVVDDSALVRKVLETGLNTDPRLTVVGTAADPYAARDLIIQNKPDVITLDVEMPKMDGVEFLRRLMAQMPIPVVMVSSLTERGAQATFDALEAGAVDFVTKPGSQYGGRGLDAMMQELRTKVLAAARACHPLAWADTGKAPQNAKPCNGTYHGQGHRVGGVNRRH